ncbi:MAG: Gfo/Idh/MocA family oxidoreductase [Fimbriimonadaceae bacterium]
MKFGAIGWGLKGGVALYAHAPAKGRRLAALADPSAEAQAKFRERVGDDAQTFDDYRSLLDLGLDAIFVLSLDFLHEEQAVACLEAGVPIYLEKPMAITVEGCDRILEVAHRTGTKLFVGHNMRYFSVVRKMREFIEKGSIGEPKTAWCRHFVSYGGEAYYRDWHADRTKSTSLLFQKASHDIDVLHFLCGGFTRRTVAMGKLMVYGDIQDRAAPGERVPVEFAGSWPPLSLTKLNPVVDVEDVSMMPMELDNGMLASYQQCHFTRDARRNYTVVGTEGRIENFGDAPGDSVIRIWDSMRYSHAPVGDLEYRPPASIGGHGGADALIVAEFVEYLETGKSTLATPLAARMSVAAGVAATESLRSGSVPVEVAPVSDALRARFG